MIQPSKERNLVLLLFLFSLFVFTRALSMHGVEYRDDEIFYFQSTQEMLQEGNFLSPTYFGEDRFQKPILFYWLIMLSYKVLGMDWFAARFVASVFAALSVCFTYLLAKVFFSQRVSLLSAFIVMSLPLFLRHAKNVVPDMPLNFFILVSVYCAVIYLKDPTKKGANLLIYIFSAAGFMVKGFAALFPIGIVIVYLLCRGKARRIKELRLGRGIFLWLCIVSPWFLYMIHVHGGGYLEYMLVEETKERIFGYEYSQLLFVQTKRLLSNTVFYLRTILSYFLPWSLIAFFAFPILIFRPEEKEEAREGLGLCFIWMALVFFIFANMYFSISHYMLIMSTPFAIIVSFFIMESLNGTPRQKIKQTALDLFILVALGIGFFAFGFLAVFLANSPTFWFFVLIAVYFGIMFLVIKNKDPITAPMIISLFIVFIFSQSGLMAKAGVASHGTLQLFARTIHQDARDSAVIGVGSHDIHEKEFQVYFKKKLIKAGHSHQGAMQQKLGGLFDRKEEVYCLLTQKDYNEYHSVLKRFNPQIIQEEFLIRKRMNLDKGFLKALLRLDQGGVRPYLMEKVILIKKKANG